jgi:phage tail-like protein
MADSGGRNDPYASFNFIVQIDGIDVAGFSEVSGLSAETDPIEYRNGDEDLTVRKLAGLRKYANISLKRGLTDSKALWDWRKTVMQGQTERKSGTITLKNEAREDAMKWSFKEAWPNKWEGPSFNAKNNEVAIETLEIVVEDLSIE